MSIVLIGKILVSEGIEGYSSDLWLAASNLKDLLRISLHQNLIQLQLNQGPGQ